MPSDNASLLNDIHTYGINLKNREIYLHSYYGHSEEEIGVEYRMATTFVKNLHTLESISEDGVLVHMHSVGGEWNDGMAIFNAIEYSPCAITIIAYAHAVSMSSIILQAADYRVLMPDADFMVHFGELSVEGHSLCVESSVEFNKKANERMLDIYTENCSNGVYFKGKSLPKVKSHIRNQINKKGDWWLSAEDAKHYGFSDYIIGEKGYEDIKKIRKNV